MSTRRFGALAIHVNLSWTIRISPGYRGLIIAGTTQGKLRFAKMAEPLPCVRPRDICNSTLCTCRDIHRHHHGWTHQSIDEEVSPSALRLSRPCLLLLALRIILLFVRDRQRFVERIMCFLLVCSFPWPFPFELTSHRWTLPRRSCSFVGSTRCLPNRLHLPKPDIFNGVIPCIRCLKFIISHFPCVFSFLSCSLNSRDRRYSCFAPRDPSAGFIVFLTCDRWLHYPHVWLRRLWLARRCFALLRKLLPSSMAEALLRQDFHGPP